LRNRRQLNYRRRNLAEREENLREKQEALRVAEANVTSQSTVRTGPGRPRAHRGGEDRFRMAQARAQRRLEKAIADRQRAEREYDRAVEGLGRARNAARLAEVQHRREQLRITLARQRQAAALLNEVLNTKNLGVPTTGLGAAQRGVAYGGVGSELADEEERREQRRLEAQRGQRQSGQSR